MNKANDFIRKLKLLREEDFIWLIYFFIVIFALIANAFEENYLFTKNTRARNTGRKINIILLTVAFIIYFYYVVVAIDDINLLKYDFYDIMK